MNLPSKIFLIGFMGSGKSTLGKKIAKQIGYSFFDLDAEIENDEKRTITEIFNCDGEKYFRNLESKKISSLKDNHNNLVVALGGGTPCFNNNMETIKELGPTIYLKYNPGILASRLLNAKTKRPLIANKTNEEVKVFVEELLRERELVYLQSSLRIEGNNITSNQVVDLLLKNI